MNTFLICIIICSVYSIVIYQVLNKKINKKIENKTVLKDVKEEINLLITQINETSDRNVLLIENRLERLNSLLSASDIKLSKLKSAIVEKVPNPVDSNNTIELEVVEESTTEEVKLDTPFNEKVDETIIKDNPSLTRRERILLLHKQGISSSVIASQTRSTIGEVELIISLSRG